LVPSKSALYGEKSWNVFIKNLHLFSTEERITWISWFAMGVSKLSAKVFFKSELKFLSRFHLSTLIVIVIINFIGIVIGMNDPLKVNKVST